MDTHGNPTSLFFTQFTCMTLLLLCFSRSLNDLFMLRDHFTFTFLFHFNISPCDFSMLCPLLQRRRHHPPHHDLHHCVVAVVVLGLPWSLHSSRIMLSYCHHRGRKLSSGLKVYIYYININYKLLKYLEHSGILKLNGPYCEKYCVDAINGCECAKCAHGAIKVATTTKKQINIRGQHRKNFNSVVESNLWCQRTKNWDGLSFPLQATTDKR